MMSMMGIAGNVKGGYLHGLPSNQYSGSNLIFCYCISFLSPKSTSFVIVQEGFVQEMAREKLMLMCG